LADINRQILVIIKVPNPEFQPHDTRFCKQLRAFPSRRFGALFHEAFGPEFDIFNAIATLLVS
jgi:hypothetical protein